MYGLPHQFLTDERNPLVWIDLIHDKEVEEWKWVGIDGQVGEKQGIISEMKSDSFNEFKNSYCIVMSKNGLMKKMICGSDKHVRRSLCMFDVETCKANNE